MRKEHKSFAAHLMAADEAENDSRLRGLLSESGLFERLQGRLPRVEVDGQALYVAEGDTLLDEDQLLVYAGQRAAAERVAHIVQETVAAGLGVTDLLAGAVGAGGISRGLLGMVQNGRIVRWRPGTVLSYCVLRNTFPSGDQYRLVRDSMQLATQEWAAACGVQFQYREAFDTSDSVRPAGVLFPVRWLDVGGQFIAASFFPNDPANRRRIVIDPSYFSTTFDKVGVLRHELGHVLGFRHEQIRPGAPPQCLGEDTAGVVALTPYDKRSVMHYMCGDAGSIALAISDLDRTGAQRVYGPPLSAFRFVSANPDDEAPAGLGASGLAEPEVAPPPHEDSSYLSSRQVGVAGYDESYFDKPAPEGALADADADTGSARDGGDSAAQDAPAAGEGS